MRSGARGRVCTCIRDPRDVRRVAVRDPDCPRHVIIDA